MSISLRTHKLLWALSGSKCAFEGCRADLVEPVREDAHSVVGEECHIVAREPKGPRADSSMPLDDRDSYSNLILMCLKHHKVIDDHPTTYTVPLLHELKKKHEAWFKGLGTFDKKKQRDDLFYADVIDKWQRHATIDHWEAWTSWFLAASGPETKVRTLKELRELHRWLFALDLPNRYGKLNRALRNFRFVLGDLLNVFSEYSEEDGYEDGDEGDVTVRTERFYKQGYVTEELYQERLAAYNEHVDLVCSLVFELTCAANWVVARTQIAISHEFRRMDGLLIVQYGDVMRMKVLKLKYRATELASGEPYPGLEKFKEVKKSRIYGRYVGPFEDE